MPTARHGTVSLHYESTGAGAPVLLVMGLGMNATGWWRTVPALAAARLRVLTFDNRGVGRSDGPLGPYTTAVMAADAVAVLDAAAVQFAHVYGISLGGMIAQEIALRHPDRVARLVLGATTPGGSGAIPADVETLEFFHRRGHMPAEDAVWASVPYTYSRRTRVQHGERIVQDIRQRLRYPIEPEPYAPPSSPPPSVTRLTIASRGSGHQRSSSTGAVCELPKREGGLGIAAEAVRVSPVQEQPSRSCRSGASPQGPAFGTIGSGDDSTFRRRSWTATARYSPGGGCSSPSNAENCPMTSCWVNGSSEIGVP